MENAELLRLYSLHLGHRGLMANTVAVHGRRLEAMGRFANKSLLSVEQKDVHAFLDSRDLAPRSRCQWLSALHCFYRWAVEEELTQTDPSARIPRPRVPQDLPRPAHTEQLRLALEKADRKMRCWLLLAAYMGLRCQEIAGIRREDVLEAENVLRVTRGKGAKERILPLHPMVAEALRDLPMPARGWLFRRPMGGPYQPWMLSQHFNKWLREVGVEATAHQLRHWFATNLYRSTHDLRLTQEMLGHADPKTTAIYTAFDRSQAAQAVATLDFG